MTDSVSMTLPGRAPKRGIVVLCRLMSLVCLAVALAVLSSVLLFAFATPADESTLEVSGKVIRGTTAKWIAEGVLLPPLIPLLWGLWNAHRCFAGIARGAMFSRTTVSAFRNFALGMLGYKAAPLVFGLAAAVIATRGHVFHGKADFRFSPTEVIESLVTLVFLGAIAIIAEVMTRATELAEDNAQIV